MEDEKLNYVWWSVIGIMEKEFINFGIKFLDLINFGVIKKWNWDIFWLYEIRIAGPILK